MPEGGLQQWQVLERRNTQWDLQENLSSDEANLVDSHQQSVSVRKLEPRSYGRMQTSSLITSNHARRGKPTCPHHAGVDSPSGAWVYHRSTTLTRLPWTSAHTCPPPPCPTIFDNLNHRTTLSRYGDINVRQTASFVRFSHFSLRIGNGSIPMSSLQMMPSMISSAPPPIEMRRLSR